MTARRSIFGLAVAAFLLVPASLHGQTIKAGKWTGTITPPGNASVDATFDVSVHGDSIALTLNGPFGSISATKVVVHTDRLTFTFSPGTTVNCTLMGQDDGGYAGDCLDTDGDKGVIVMHPPAGEEAAAAGVELLRERDGT